jgi:hypothetical protein
MAIQAIGAVSSTPAAAVNQTAGGTAPKQAARSGGVQAGGGANSTIVVSKTTKVNADGSVTTTTTYADGHVETQTTPASLAAAVSPLAAAANRNTPQAARGNNLDVTA